MISTLPVFGQSDILVQNYQEAEEFSYSINAGGGVALSQQGNYSYSIGQIFASQEFKQDEQIDSGIQQNESIEEELYGIEIKDSIQVVLYPNPVTDILFVDVTSQNYSELSYKVFNFNGKLIMNELIDNSISEIKFDYLSDGIYLFILNYKDEFVKSTKIIKK